MKPGLKEPDGAYGSGIRCVKRVAEEGRSARPGAGLDLRANESPRRRLGGSGARPRLEARPVSGRERDLLRSREPRHRTARHLPPDRRDRHRGAGRLRRDDEGRPDGGGARAPAHAGSRRRARQEAPPRLRSEQAGRRAGGVESLLQGVHAEVRDPDARGRGLHHARRGGEGGKGAGPSVRFQGGRPRGRQGRRHRPGRGGPGQGPQALLRRTGFRERGGPRPDRALRHRGRGQLHGPLRRRTGHPSRDREGLQAGLRR